jgi:hypothetical protein
MINYNHEQMGNQLYNAAPIHYKIFINHKSQRETKFAVEAQLDYTFLLATCFFNRLNNNFLPFFAGKIGNRQVRDRLATA